MGSPADRHRRVAGEFTARVRGVDDWDAPAPVDGWAARDVVGHLVEWLPGLLAAGSTVTLASGPSVADDPAGAWQVHCDGVQAVLEDPVAAGQPFHNPHVGEMTVAEAIDQLYTSDVFMHTWDLARATGQDDRLDPDVCAELLEGMAPYEDAMRGSGQYGPAHPVAPDAPVQDRLLAFIGRDPSWRPELDS